MKKQTFGMLVASLRKQKGMTQLDLAAKMGVTDKAVSKWERDLSYPDVGSLPRLAEVFGISVDALMQVEPRAQTEEGKEETARLIDLICKAVALAMGVALFVLSILILATNLAAKALFRFLATERRDAASRCLPAGAGRILKQIAGGTK